MYKIEIKKIELARKMRKRTSDSNIKTFKHMRDISYTIVNESDFERVKKEIP